MKDELRFALDLVEIYDFVPYPENLDMDDLVEALSKPQPAQEIIDRTLENYAGYDYSSLVSKILENYFK